MGGPGTLLAALWALGSVGSAALRIGAFNIQSFGDSKVSDPACSSVIAQVRPGAALGCIGVPKLLNLITPPPDPGWLRCHACAGGAGPRPERRHNAPGADQQVWAKPLREPLTLIVGSAQHLALLSTACPNTSTAL